MHAKFQRYFYFWSFYNTVQRKGVTLFFPCNFWEFHISFMPRSYLVSSSFISKTGILVSTEIKIFTGSPPSLGWIKARPSIDVRCKNQRENAPLMWELGSAQITVLTFLAVGWCLVGPPLVVFPCSSVFLPLPDAARTADREPQSGFATKEKWSG